MAEIRKGVPWELAQEGLRLWIRLTPKSSKAGIRGLYEDETQKVYLKVSVTALPEEGKANEALVAFLSKWLKWPRSLVKIVKGHTSREKYILILPSQTTTVSQEEYVKLKKVFEDALINIP